MSIPLIDDGYLLDFLTGLLNTPSPTGYAHRAIAYTEQALKAFPTMKLSRTRKGALVAEWSGKSAVTPRALTAHADTLGAMVKESVNFQSLGGWMRKDIDRDIDDMPVLPPEVVDIVSVFEDFSIRVRKA